MMAEQLPRQFSRYQLLDVVMRDGFGTVYRAHDTHYDRDVWVRILDADLASDPATAQQFERGARLALGLSHPNLIQVYEVGVADNLPFMTFRPAEGESLADRLVKESPIFPLRAAFIISQISDALAYLHERWLAHGNLHDRSIWLSNDDQVSLLDLGLAPGVHTEAGDLEALGNLAHEMVVGAPFSRTDATMRRPGIPWRRAEDRLGPEMWSILMRAVRYEGEPYENIQAFRADFVAAAERAEPPPRETRRERVREQRERAQALAQQAGAAARLGQWEQVTELAGHALRLNPKSEEARQWLHRASRVLGGETPETVRPLLKRPQRRRAPAGAVLAAALVLVAAIGSGIWAVARPKGAAPPPTATPSATIRPTQTPQPTLVPVILPTIEPTATPQPPTPTFTPAPPIATATPNPPLPEPTSTPTPVEPLPTEPPTATPTREYWPAPEPLSPPDGAAFYGPQATIILQWDDVGTLADDEWYVVRIPHALGEEVGVTRDTQWRVPAYMWWLKPPSSRLNWSVSVRIRASETVPGNADLWPAVSDESVPRSFIWLESTSTPAPTLTPTPTP